MEKILSVEDDLELAKIIKIMVESKGYYVVSAHSVKEAIQEMEKQSFDLILLDMMLPDGEGTTLCDKIRQKSFCPIIFVSCLSDNGSKLNALNIGGDDYITKPIDFEELLAKIYVNLRRANQYNLGRSESAEERVPGLLIKKNKREVWQLDGENALVEQITLSPTEYDLLLYFIAHQNELQLYEDLFKHIWKVDYCGDVRTVMVHVSNLRKKLKEHNVDYIHTVRGVGYILSIGE